MLQCRLGIAKFALLDQIHHDVFNTYFRHAKVKIKIQQVQWCWLDCTSCMQLHYGLGTTVHFVTTLRLACYTYDIFMSRT